MLENKGIEDKIFYMHNNKIEHKAILGISTYVGKCEVLMSSNKIVPEGEFLVIYHMGSYQEIDAINAYDTLDDLMQSLTTPLNLPDGIQSRES
jgi:effector-binding domain-containing protein